MIYRHPNEFKTSDSTKQTNDKQPSKLSVPQNSSKITESSSKIVKKTTLSAIKKPLPKGSLKLKDKKTTKVPVSSMKKSNEIQNKESNEDEGSRTLTEIFSSSDEDSLSEQSREMIKTV